MSTDPDRDDAPAGRAVPFALRRDRRDHAEILVPVGELDIATAGELELGLELAASSPAARIVLDLRELTFMDSSGLNAILEAYRRLGDRLVIVRGPERIRRLFALCGLDGRLVFVDGLPDSERAEPPSPPHRAARGESRVPAGEASRVDP